MSGSPSHGEAPTEGNGAPASPVEEVPCAQLKNNYEKCVKEKDDVACKELLEAYNACLRALGIATKPLTSTY